MAWVDIADGEQVSSVQAKLNAAGAKAEASLPASGGTLVDYSESGATLTIISGVLDVPLDGKVYQVTVDEEITSITTSAAPTAPNCAASTIYFTQDATGYAVAIPATWRWPDSTITDIDTAANAESELVLNTNPAGYIIARVTPIGVPA